jgi:hypothetical protein
MRSKATSMTNEEVAAILEGTARLLELQQANPFRVRSYRKLADHLRQLDEPIGSVFAEQGEVGLRQLEGVGPRLASTLREIIETGRLGLRDRLEGELSPEALFVRVPGIGEELAQRIHDALGVESLEELEEAAHSGRLERVEGIGEKRLKGIRDSLAGMLSPSLSRRARQRLSEVETPPEPPAGLLLELDQAYREKAASGRLRQIAPKRFNPESKAWLPILEETRDHWEFTLLYSNTKRAHDLGKTRDWVVVYYETERHQDQCTIVTAGQGDLKGLRVVRGREGECRQYYARRA